MEKKEYQMPHIMVIEVSNQYGVLVESTTPTGYRIGCDDDDDDVETVNDLSWNR